ncbi:Trehalose 6-phosphate phosphatase [Psidium guajava]|nr:Trehalose 6-phosphate phosphatase [Psidium guajava]
MLPYLKEIAKCFSFVLHYLHQSIILSERSVGNPGNVQCLKLLTRPKEESSSPPVLSDPKNHPTDKCNGDHGSADLNISSPESVAHGTCSRKDQAILAEHVIQSTDSEYESSYGIVNARGEGRLQPASLYYIVVHQSKEDSPL